MTLNEAKTIFSNDRYATELTGVELTFLEPRHSVCTLEVRPEHCNAMGRVMGGAIFTLADFAFATAANSERLEWVSMESTIHYLSTAKGTILKAEAKCIREGRKSCVYEIAVSDGTERNIAIITTLGLKVDE